MTRYVPIIAVVPEGIAAVVAEMAEAPDFAALMEPARPIMDRNGWTPEAMCAGVVLADALEPEARVRRIGGAS